MALKTALKTLIILIICPLLTAFSYLIPVNTYEITPSAMFKGISEEQFDKILDDIQRVYQPIIRSKGGKLIILKDWMDPTINAYAFREGQEWYLSFYGGFARHAEMTEDGFLISVCHTLGHHLGGYPKVDWSSAEAEADYFATLKCLRRIWAKGNSIEVVKGMQIDPPVIKKCDQTWKKEIDRAICKRSAMAGKSLARLLSMETGEDSFPEFRAPDETIVTKTNESHINSQCRLDTYFQGALCTAEWKTDIGETDPNIGACRFQTIGGRPACWYFETRLSR